MSKVIIPKEEQLEAAKYFTLSNMAVLHLCEGYKNIHVAFQRANEMIIMETGCSMDEELRDWVDSVKKSKADDWMAKEWATKRTLWEL